MFLLDLYMDEYPDSIFCIVLVDLRSNKMVDQFDGAGEVDFPSWWQSKIFKAKDALVGAKQYLDFELNEPKIDAVVDIATDVVDETVEDYITSVDDLNELKHVKVFKNNSNLKGAPDGSTTDKYGNLWNAEWDGSRLVKYDTDGNILEEVAVPVKRPTSCVFGGPNLDILFITSAECESDKDTSINGNLIYFRTNTKGVFSNRFSINNLKI